MKRKTTVRLTYLAVAAVTAAAAWVLVQRYEEKQELGLRVRNVEILMSLLREKPDCVTIDEVIAEARSRGMELFNPKPDSSLESLYRLHSSGQEAPDAVVVEECGIDSRWLVQGLGDGSVVVREASVRR